MDKIEFIASLPDIQSALNISGVDRNARIKLDIPGSEIAAVMRLVTLTGKAFKVSVELLPEAEPSEPKDRRSWRSQTSNSDS